MDENAFSNFKAQHRYEPSRPCHITTGLYQTQLGSEAHSLAGSTPGKCGGKCVYIYVHVYLCICTYIYICSYIRSHLMISQYDQALC